MFGPVRAVLVVAVIGIFVIGGVGLVPRSGDVGGPMVEASPIPSPAPLEPGPLLAGTYTVTPFEAPSRVGLCTAPPQPDCIEPTDDDAIRFTFTVPDAWQSGPTDFGSVWSTSREADADSEAAVIFLRGSGLHSDPCRNDFAPPVIHVGPTVDDFATALAEHPLLETTTPVDVTLAGYSGRYLDLQVPSDISGCGAYLPWDPGLNAQEPDRRWHLWVLDVDGMRVVVQTIDYAGTSPELQAELASIVGSIAIEPATAPAASPSPGPLAWSPASRKQDWPAPVRAEPAGDPILVPRTLIDGYEDPSGDIESDLPWIDIQGVRRSESGSVYVDFGALAPSPLAGSNEPWIAYGLVLDTDLDGVADLRLGMDNMPPPGSAQVIGSNPHWWLWDLHAGQSRSGHCDCIVFGGPGDQVSAHIWYVEHGIPGRFYAWASVIQGGRVVATDYAPDAGWLNTTGSIPAETQAASPSQ